MFLRVKGGDWWRVGRFGGGRDGERKGGGWVREKERERGRSITPACESLPREATCRLT